MRKIYVIAFTLITSIILTSCQSEPLVAPIYPQITFTNSKPFVMDIASVEVVQEYNPPLNAPNVDHLFLVTPSQAVKIWGRDRIAAKGKSRSMRLVIKDASVVAQPLPRTEGLKGMFTKDQAVNYTARLNVKLEIFADDPLFPESEVSIDVNRSKTIGEDASINDRNALFYALTTELIGDFNKSAETNISAYFYKYLIN